MRAFIVRPFGTKKDLDGKEIDFDAVQRDLIDPVLTQLGIHGRTTIDIAKAGNIREDMFRLLVTADVVVADISVHNANVFYELGIRHALRDRTTFLIRCKADKLPFDLQTDRYLEYDRLDPAASRDSLRQGLQQSKVSETRDSPVFALLPKLKAHPRSLFLVVPTGFSQEVDRALQDKQAGDLGLLAEEARGFEWESEGLRLVGRAQFDLKAYGGAKSTWEALRELEPADHEADQKLGTIYQRLDDLTRSDQALRRALVQETAPPRTRADLLSQLGRNAKACWTREWKSLPAGEARRTAALRSPWLEKACSAYTEGFEEDLGYFYPGINALALLTMQTELAAAHPAVWEGHYEDAESAGRELQKLNRTKGQLAAAVDLAIEAARRKLSRTGKSDPWVAVSGADLRYLTSANPGYVAKSFRGAIADVPDFVSASARDQLTLYQLLDLRTANTDAALAEFPAAPPAAAASDALPVLLFTGHQIDAADAAKPRFPADREDVARQTIRHAVEKEKTDSGGIQCAIAGGASGGDILFHEICNELGIPSFLYLAGPPEQFIVTSVAPAGPRWIERFKAIHRRLLSAGRVRQLSDTLELPGWLSHKPDYSIWQRNNLWTLHNALALATDGITLIALWNGGPGRGPGGTGDMVRKAQASGQKTVVLDTRALFGLPA